jgi:class 3 adenylate cyclase
MHASSNENPRSDSRRVTLPPEWESVLLASQLLNGVHSASSLEPDLIWVPEGGYLCRVGQPADCLWVVMSGEIAIQVDGVTIVRRGRAAVIGEQGLVNAPAQRGADMTALGGATTLLCVSRAAIDAHPDSVALWKNISQVISAKLNQATRDRALLKLGEKELQAERRRYLGRFAPGLERMLASAKLGFARQTAVIWFSDVVGFSRLALDLAPELVGEIVQQFSIPQVDAIEANDGDIDKFMGDGIMAFWRVPVGAETDICRRALLAAERSVDAVRAIVVQGEQLNLRVGLHIGEVVAGPVGTSMRAQFTLLGNAVNLAARLEQAKEGLTGERLGAVRVSAPFFQHLPTEEQTRVRDNVLIAARNLRNQVVYMTRT